MYDFLSFSLVYMRDSLERFSYNMMPVFTAFGKNQGFSNLP